MTTTNADLVGALRDEVAQLKARLAEAAKQETAAAEILRVIGSSSSDVQPTFQAIVESATRLCRGVSCLLILFDGRLMHLAAHHNVSSERLDALEQLFPMPPSRGSVSGRAILTGAVAQVEDISKDPEYALPVATTVGFRSALAVPMLRDGVPIGAIGVARDRVAPFSNTEIELLRTFAAQAVIAIENVRLFKALEDRNSELTVALEQQTATSNLLKVIGRSSLDLQPVFETLAENAVRLCEAERALIYRFDGQLLRVVATHNVSADVRDFVERNPLGLGRGSGAGRAALERRTIHIHDIESDPEYTYGARQVEPVRTVLAIPMLRANELLGVITIYRHEVRPFADSQVALMETFADQAVIAIENARLVTETREALARQTATAEILQVINASPGDLAPVFDAMLEQALSLCDAAYGALRLYDGEAFGLAAVRGGNQGWEEWVRKLGPVRPEPGSIFARFLQGEDIVHIADAADTEPYRSGELTVRRGLVDIGGFHTLLGIALRKEGALVGTLQLFRRMVRLFSDKEIALLQNFADQAVIAIVNARLLGELRTRTAELARSVDELTATANVLRVISSSPGDLTPVYDAMLENATRICEADFGDMWTYDGQCLKHVAASRDTPSELVAVIVERGPFQPHRGNLSGRVVLESRIVQIDDAANDPDYTWTDAQLAGKFRTMLGVPLLREGMLIGEFSLMRTRVESFTEKQIALVTTFADQAVIAIENARLLGELQAKNAHLTEALEQQTATAEILRVISSSPTDVQPVFETIARNAARLCDGQFCFVLRFDGDLLHVGAGYGLTAEGLAAFQQTMPRPAGEDTAGGRAILRRAVVQIPDVRTDPAYGVWGIVQAVGYRSLLAVPMLRDGSPIGAIAVGRAHAGPFSEGQIAVLKTFADQAVIAIENVRLFRELETRNAELTGSLARETATAEVLRAISRSQTDAQPVFDIIAASALRLCGGCHSSVLLYEGELLRFASLANVNPIGAEAFGRGYQMPADQRSASGRAVLARTVVQISDVLADRAFGLTSHTEALGVRSVLAAPMLRAGEVIGAIVVGRPEPGLFPESQIELLKTFADQAVIAIENVRLFRELEDRNAELTGSLARQTATSEVLRAISRAQTDAQPVFDIIAASALRLCGGGHSGVWLYDGELLRLASLANVDPIGAEVVRRTSPRPADQRSGGGRAVLARAVVQIPDVLEDPAYGLGSLAEALGFRSFLAAPMLRAGDVIGVIGVGRPQPGPFPESQVELLKTFADQAVIAIENVRLFQELEARTRDLTRSVGELRALGEVSQAVSSTLDLEAVLATIVSRAVELSGSYGGIVYEFDGATQSFHARASHRISPDHLAALQARPVRLGEGAVGRAGEIRKPVEVADIEKEGQLVYAHVRRFLTWEGARSLLAVPLVREERLLGGLVILRQERGSFSAEVIATLQTFATQSVLAIHNARLFQEVQRQKQYSDALVQTSPVAIVTMDLGGKVVGWNPGAERLFAYTPAEALGRSMEELVATPEVRDEVLANIRRTLEGEWIRGIARRARKDGTLVDVEISSMPVVVGGVKVGMIGIYHDITELLRARREAEAANEAKSAFLATMSHEIRTPLNAVIGMSGLLLNTALSDEQREYAEVVHQSGDALLTVINDILDFSKIEAGKLELEFQRFDLRECVEGALDLVATRAAEKGLDLAYLVHDGTPPAIVGDVTRLRQVLLNLLSNAVKFTERGEVVLSVSARRLDGAATLHELTFSVRDTGIGIPADRLGRLFQSFSQIDASTTRRYGGTGLGLAISGRLTELMGGRIDVTSEVGIGSEFRFTIRAAAAEAPLPPRRGLSGVQPSLQGKRVLVVDDNTTNRHILAAHLEDWGMPARATASPVEALEWIRAEERFDIAILDMHMPEMDGVALAAAIRGYPAGAALPLVLFTSLGRREVRADSQGFAAYLNKPIKPSHLFDALVSVLAETPVHGPQHSVARHEFDPEMARRHPLRILLAEDNVVNQKVALRLLGQMGYRADVAANGLEAIAAVERQTYDVILMDVQMPELDGFEASREINRRWPGSSHPRLVAMTANAMQGDRELCAAAGMDDYVAKPIRIDELIAALGRCRRRPEPDLRGAPGEAPSAAPTVDRTAFERLTATMGAGFVAELIDTFVEDGRALIATLGQALAARDLDAFRRAAHSLKSNSETLGAAGLAAAARELEAMARAGSLDGAEDRIEPLGRGYEQLVRELQELRRGLAA